MAKTLDQNLMAALATNGPTLTPDQLRWLTPDQLRWLTPDQLCWLTPDQLCWLTPDQLRWLTPDQLCGLTPDQLCGLTPDQLCWLTPDQLCVLTADQLRGLTPAQLRWLTADQLRGLTPAQLRWLTPDQLCGLTPDQLRWLTSDQLCGLGNDLSYQVENLYSKIDDGIRKIEQSTFGPQEEEINICETPMCIAGHTVHLAGHQGFLLAKRIGWGPAAQIIHLRSRPDIPAPRYDSYPTEWARAYISIHAAEESR